MAKKNRARRTADSLQQEYRAELSRLRSSVDPIREADAEGLLRALSEVDLDGVPFRLADAVANVARAQPEAVARPTVATFFREIGSLGDAILANRERVAAKDLKAIAADPDHKPIEPYSQKAEGAAVQFMESCFDAAAKAFMQAYPGLPQWVADVAHVQKSTASTKLSREFESCRIDYKGDVADAARVAECVDRIKAPRPAEANALAAYELACNLLNNPNATDDEAYSEYKRYAKENELPLSRAGLRSPGAFKQALRRGRPNVGKQKYNRGCGMQTRSIVAPNQIARPAIASTRGKPPASADLHALASDLAVGSLTSDEARPSLQRHGLEEHEIEKILSSDTPAVAILQVADRMESAAEQVLKRQKKTSRRNLRFSFLALKG